MKASWGSKGSWGGWGREMLVSEDRPHFRGDCYTASKPLSGFDLTSARIEGTQLFNVALDGLTNGI